MFYYTFSVINTMFVPCTALLYDSTAATRTLNCPQLYWAFLVESIWFLFWWCPLLSVDCFHKLFLSDTPQKIVRQVEILRIGWPGVIGLTQNESVPWEGMPEVFQVFCSRNKAPSHFSNRTLEYLRHNFPWDRFISRQTVTPDNPIPKISTRLTIFWGGAWKTEFIKTIYRQKRTSSGKKLDRFHKKCSVELWTILIFELLLYCHTAVRYMERA